MMRVVVWSPIAQAQVMQALAGLPGIDAFGVRSYGEFVETLDRVDGAVILGGPRSYTSEVAERLRVAPRMKWLQLVSAGYEGVEANGLPEHVSLTGPGEGISSAVAEHAMALLWALARGFAPAGRQQAQRTWDRAFNKQMTTLSGRTVLVFGLGAIGRKIAHHAQAIGMRAIGVSESGRPVAELERVIQTAQLRDVLPEARALILALPLRDSTRHILDGAVLGRFARESSSSMWGAES